MIPLYGFLQGDTVGLLILAEEEERVAALIDKLQSAARVRVAPRPTTSLDLLLNGAVINPGETLQRVGMKALDRFVVRVRTEEDE